MIKIDLAAMLYYLEVRAAYRNARRNYQTRVTVRGETFDSGMTFVWLCEHGYLYESDKFRKKKPKKQFYRIRL